MIKDHEEIISYTGHTNLPYEISGDEEELSLLQSVGIAILVFGVMWILAIIILSI